MPEPVVARPGVVLGQRYEVRSLLGTGAMAQVWSATDQSLGRVVAIKLLHAHLHSDAPSVERFRREAIAVAALSHPNIVSVFDTIFGDGVEAIVMEYVDGTTLRAVLDDRGSLSQDETVELGAKLANALAHAHHSGVIHRDIKPANILITSSGTPKLTDFGIAKGAAETDLTVVGTIIGTPSYLAPEHVQNQPVDRRADLYSLCVVLYEAIVGRVPFVGEDPTAVALARLHQHPTPILDLAPATDPDLAAVIMRGLQRSPDQRFQSATDLESALRTPTNYRFFNTVYVETFEVVGDDVLDEPFVDDSYEHDSDLRPSRPGRTPVAQPKKSIVGRLLLVVLCLGPIGVLVALAMSPLRDSAPPTTTQAAPQRIEIPIRSAQSFDPEGDGVEHDDTVANLIDGDPDTSWTTERYNNQQFGTKSGVGVVVDLGDSFDIEEVQFDSVPGWSGFVAVTQTNPIDSDLVPDPTQRVAATDERFGVGLNHVPGRYVTVWIEDLGPAIDGRHIVTIAAISVVGRAAP